MLLNKNYLHPDKFFIPVSDIISMHAKTLKEHITLPFRYTENVPAGINRKQLVLSAVGCLAADCSNNSLPPALVGYCSNIKCYITASKDTKVSNACNL